MDNEVIGDSRRLKNTTGKKVLLWAGAVASVVGLLASVWFMMFVHGGMQMYPSIELNVVAPHSDVSVVEVQGEGVAAQYSRVVVMGHALPAVPLLQAAGMIPFGLSALGFLLLGVYSVARLVKGRNVGNLGAMSLAVLGIAVIVGAGFALPALEDTAAVIVVEELGMPTEGIVDSDSGFEEIAWIPRPVYMVGEADWGFVGLGAIIAFVGFRGVKRRVNPL